MFGCFSEAEYSAYLSRIGRADERTRTADLLITSKPVPYSGSRLKWLFYRYLSP